PTYPPAGLAGEQGHQKLGAFLSLNLDLGSELVGLRLVVKQIYITNSLLSIFKADHSAAKSSSEVSIFSRPWLTGESPSGRTCSVADRHFARPPAGPDPPAPGHP